MVFENRSAADFLVREHRKRRKSRQASGRGAFTGRLSDFDQVIVELIGVGSRNREMLGQHDTDRFDRLDEAVG